MKLFQKTPKNHQVILVHGYKKDPSDMAVLSVGLAKLGYEVESPLLPTSSKGVWRNVDEFQRWFEEREARDQYGQDGATLHLVGHSMGGLIIRGLLSRRPLKGLGRVVMIGTPNRGSKLADIATKYVKGFHFLRPPVKDFSGGGLTIPNPQNNPMPEMGGIAGNNSNLYFGAMMQGPNDGRVEVESVRLPGMTDFAVLPFGHHEMHQYEISTEYVHHFLMNGRFPGGSEV